MGITKSALITRNCSLVMNFSSLIITFRFKQSCKTKGACERVRVLLAKHFCAKLERLVVHSCGRVVLPLATEHSSEVVHARERLGVLLAEHFYAKLELFS